MFRLFERRKLAREGAELDALEPLLAACLEAYAERGAAAIEELCASHPEHAERIRSRVASLARIGLLGEEREEDPPGSFGPYGILRRLGQGGMGTVYLAFDPKRATRVALKVGHSAAGANDRARVRFEREIRAVAQLEHEGILKILDVGEAEGRPFFTMEYVEGATLAEIVAELRRERVGFEELASESVRRVVHAKSSSHERGEAASAHAAGRWGRTYVETICRLALDVARALAHAHEHGIVHRDVKPSNVIVRRDGQALLLDFGLAHVDEEPSLTRSGDFAGTPYYVSPEQIGRARDADGRTDVYSLGVTLYELATLHRPFDGRATPEIFRAIQVEEPALPRKWNPLVPRDLETIVLTAMEKDPSRRYTSAGEMAEDLARFLAFRPVKAKPIGALRRGARLVRRKPALAAACALAALVLVGLPIGLVLANAAIREQRDLAQRAADSAQKQAALNAKELEFLVELFHLTGPETPASPGGEDRKRGETVTAREILDQGVQRIESEFADDPLVCAALMEATGRVYHNLGLRERALPLLDRSFAIRHRELGEHHLDVAVVLNELAAVHLESGNVGAALALAQRGLAALESSGNDADLAAARSHAVLARATQSLGQRDLAEEHWLAALSILRARGGPASEATAEALEQLGVLARDRGASELAAERFSEALAERRETWAPDPLALARTLELLADAHERSGASELAARASAEALVLRRGGSGSVELAHGSSAAAPNPVPAEAPSPFELTPAWKPRYDEHFQLGITALQSGEYPSAERAFERCLELDPTHPVCAYNMCCARALSGDVAAALDWFARAAQWGFGRSSERLEVARKDADLDSIRALPRFAEIFERMERSRAAADRFSAEPAFHVPAGPAPREGWPLLVVLHAGGDTKDGVVRGPWKEVADELGLALLAPSGRWPVASDPEAGMEWIESAADFLAQPLAFEQPVRDDVRRFCEEQPIDRGRVVIAGEGLGALLAFDLALRAPALFQRVLVRDGPFGIDVSRERALAAASIGLRVEIVLDLRAKVAGAPADASSEELALSIERWLSSRGLGDGSRVSVCPDLAEAGDDCRLSDAVRALLR